MAGIRLHHAAERNAVLTVVDNARPYTQPYFCATCSRTHENKTYHLSLDAEGDAFISRTGWNRVKWIAAAAGLVAENEVKRPPEHVIRMGGGIRIPGIYLEHAYARNQVVVVPTPRLLSKPYLCAACNQEHATKTYHLGVDARGIVVVSETIYERLEEVGMGGFRVVGELTPDESVPPLKFTVDNAPPPARVVAA